MADNVIDTWMCVLCGRGKLPRPATPHRCICGTVTKNFRKMAKLRGLNTAFKIEEK